MSLILMGAHIKQRTCTSKKDHNFFLWYVGIRNTALVFKTLYFSYTAPSVPSPFVPCPPLHLQHHLFPLNLIFLLTPFPP